MDCKENYYNKFEKRHSTHTKPILEMFMEICRKLDRNSREYLSKVIPIDEDKSMLNETDTIIILNYLKQIVIYLIKTKLELEERAMIVDSSNQYETLIQKLEADVRQHIRIEQQLRLYTDTLQQKVDEFIVERNQQGELIREYEQQIKQKNKDIIVYQSELRKAVNRHQQKFMKTVTEPVEQESRMPIRKSSQTIQTSPQHSKHLFIKNSPDKIQPRKISVANYAETNAIKQPVFIKQPCPISNMNLTSYRSTSQDQLYKLK